MNDVLTAGSRFNDLKLENLKTSVDAMIDADESAGSRYSRAINSLSQKFDIKDINEIQQSIVDAFSDIIDKECSTRPEKSRHDVIREVTPQSMFSATEQRFKNFYDFCVSKNAKASVISKLAMVLENFNDFCVIASTDINKSEGLSFNLDSLKVSKRNDTPSQIEDGEDVIEEEAIKEG
jgi:hypothetical protein